MTFVYSLATGIVAFCLGVGLAGKVKAGFAALLSKAKSDAKAKIDKVL